MSNMFENFDRPKTCGKCAKSFCKNCINYSLEKTKNCPYCSAIFLENRIMGTVTRNLLEICKFNCYYKNKGCQEKISYSNFFNHIKKCDYEQYECNNIKYSYEIIGNKKFSKTQFIGEKCKFKGNKNDLKLHVKNCGLDIIFCICCEKGFCSINIKKHCEICYKIKGKCPYCKKEIILLNYDEHIQNDCEEVEINCDECEMKFLRKNLINHNKIECLEKQVKNIKKNFEKLEEIVKNFIQNKRQREDN